MAEDTRPKVAMTKVELTKILNLSELSKRNSKSKQCDTMLDMLCSYFISTKQSGLIVDFPDSAKTPAMVKSLTQVQVPVKKETFSKTAAGGFYKAPTRKIVEDDAAYEWDESPGKKKETNKPNATGANFFKPPQQKR